MRWAAIGAAVAVTLGAGGIGIARATVSSGERSVFVPIEPCRLFDTRAGANNVGPRSTPLRADESHAFQVTGTNGDCVVPPGATAVSINLTGVGPTASTNLRMYPAGATVPNASVLNMSAGQAPLPNKIDVQLSSSGQVAIYNRFGRIDVIGDVMGYYEGHDHDDRYFTKAEVRAIVDEAVAASSGPSGAAGGSIGPTVYLPDAGSIVEAASIEVVAPAAGVVEVSASGAASDQAIGGKVFCSITTGTTLDESLQAWESAGPNGSIGQLSGSRTFEVAAGSHTFRWICQSVTSDDAVDASISGPSITYVFVPD